MGIGTFFSKASDLLAAQSPEQRALMLAVAGGVNPAPGMRQALIGQSQSAMQAIQAQEQRKMAEAQAEMDRQQRMAELQATLKDRRKDRGLQRKIAKDDKQVRRDEAAARLAETRDYNLARLADASGMNKEREGYYAAQRAQVELQAREQQMRLDRAREAMEAGKMDEALRWMSGGYSAPDAVTAMIGGGGVPGGGIGGMPGQPGMGKPEINYNELIRIGAGKPPGQ